MSNEKIDTTKCLNGQMSDGENVYLVMDKMSNREILTESSVESRTTLIKSVRIFYGVPSSASCEPVTHL